MIAQGELSQQKCTDKGVLEQLAILMAPFTPHIAEELWEMMGHTTSICDAEWPECDEQYLKVDEETLSISFNGKTRFTMKFSPEASREEIEQAALQAEDAQRYLEGKTVVKVIVVPHRIVNIVIK